MRNTRLAEGILSLVTTPERAASMVGDWMEDRDRRLSGVRFWASVWHTTLSLLVRDLAANPARMAGLAALGVLFELMLLAALTVAVAIGLGAAIGLRLVDPQHLGSWFSPPPGATNLTLTGYLALAAFVTDLLLQFQVGRMLAKRSPGHELAPCIALIGLQWAIGWLLEMTGGPFRPAGASLAPSLAQIPSLALLLSGAIVARRRRITTSDAIQTRADG